ncbi:MAG: hypothetical protein ACYTFI_23405, partial [Planctomycetota bacterium]
MEIAVLILEYIQALAWPVVVVLGLFLFREPLIAILHRLKSARLPGGTSFDFDQEVRDAETLSQEVGKTPSGRGDPSKPTVPLTEANARMLSLGLQPSPSGLQMSRYSDL